MQEIPTNSYDYRRVATGYHQINPGSKSGQSSNRNTFSRRKFLKRKKNSNIGPAVVLHIGEQAKLDTIRAYDFLGRPKRI